MDQMLDAGFWILDIKRKLSLFFQHQASPPASPERLAMAGRQDPLSETLWVKRSFSVVGSGFRVKGSWLKTDIILNSTWNVEL
jgi:hypothetical protein